MTISFFFPHFSQNLLINEVDHVHTFTNIPQNFIICFDIDTVFSQSIQLFNHMLNLYEKIDLVVMCLINDFLQKFVLF